jgi:hypothetical protein
MAMFVPVATPWSEAELASMVSLLHAHDVPHYVHNRNFGALYPGPRIPLYNVQRIMVDRQHLADAMELLAPFFAPPLDFETEKNLAASDKIRVVVEFLFLGGWFFPFKWRKPFGSSGEDT